jgi:hypothetical protein
MSIGCDFCLAARSASSRMHFLKYSDRVNPSAILRALASLSYSPGALNEMIVVFIGGVTNINNFLFCQHFLLASQLIMLINNS